VKSRFLPRNQTDFVEERVAVKVQFGKHAFVAYALFVKQLAFYVGNERVFVHEMFLLFANLALL
jgi:hypothetical protein